MNFNKKLILFSFLLPLFCTSFAFSQQRLSLEQGIDVAIHKNGHYKTAYVLTPKFEFDDVVASYSFHPVVADSVNPAGHISLHTIDIAYRKEVGVEQIRPYFMAGGGYAFYSAPTTFLNGGHLFGAFGINFILNKYSLVLGPVVKYNAVLFDSEEKIEDGDRFKYHQFISFLFNIGYTF
ncbi:MAG: hypothetical protein ABIA04_14625 [Pseudomonadota bacterium]